MKSAIKKELLYNIEQTINILETKEAKNFEQLKKLSNHAIEDVALHKDIDLISFTVFIYSLYKIINSLPEEEYQDILAELKSAYKHLQANNLSRYNKSSKLLFKIIKKCNAPIKTHLQNVMQAAKIKKSSELLRKGLSIGQAAGIMGLTNWDLQSYAGKLTTYEKSYEKKSPRARIRSILKYLKQTKSQKEKILFFDAGPIISLVMSRLIWVLPLLKKQFNAKFYITPAVKMELVGRPIKIKRFEFEALQVLKLINDGVLEVYNQVPQKKVNELIKLANSSFKIKNKYLDIIQAGEIEAATSVLQTNAEAIIMDERTLRLFIENRKEMEKLLEIRFKKDVVVNQENVDLFSDQLKNIIIIRSVELIGLAFHIGLLDNYIPKGFAGKGKEILLDSVLWATKSNGCAVTSREIDELKTYLLNVNS